MNSVGMGEKFGGESIDRFKCGGERGIRTLGAAINSTHDFQSCSFSQLGHLSAIYSFLANSPLPKQDGGEGGIRTHDPG